MGTGFKIYATVCLSMEKGKKIFFFFGATNHARLAGKVWKVTTANCIYITLICVSLSSFRMHRE